MNLLCATGLPGAEKVDLEGHLATLDAWAAQVKRETDRHLYQFRRQPEEFNYSEGYFRVLMMGTVLCEDFNVHYNSELTQINADLETSAPSDANDYFLPGVLGPNRTGTCSSMPVLYAAIGQRLGYPIKVVAAPGHVFARWDGADENDRFNIECTEHEGFSTPGDVYYIDSARLRGVKFREREVDNGYYLGSRDHVQCLGLFMNIRGACFFTHRRLLESLRAYAAAAHLDPRDAVAAAAGHAITFMLLHECRPTRHPLALPGLPDDDPRSVLSPADAARAVALNGYGFMLSGDQQLARTCFEEVVRLDPGNPQWRRLPLVGHRPAIAGVVCDPRVAPAAVKQSCSLFSDRPIGR